LENGTAVESLWLTAEQALAAKPIIEQIMMLVGGADLRDFVVQELTKEGASATKK
jgi:hypothetical protein